MPHIGMDQAAQANAEDLWAATSGTLTSVLETTWQEARSNWDQIVRASGGREIPMNPRTREQLMCKGSII